MKIFMPLLLAVTIFAACNNEEEKAAEDPKNTHLITQNLKGAVQHYEVSTSWIDSTGAAKSDSSISIYEIDEKGYTTSYTTKDLAGTLKGEQTFSYYEAGQLKEIFVKNGEGKQIRKWELSVDSSGMHNGAKVYDSAGKITSVWKNVKENEYGQAISGSEYNEDGSFKYYFEGKYDKANLVGEMGKDSTGTEHYRSTITLNDKGDASGITRWTKTKDSSVTEKFTYKYDSYDEKGNWTQMTTYNEKNKPTEVTKRTFTYYKD